MAIEVVTSYGVPNAAVVIRDYAAAGMVRTTAKVLEWVEAGGIHTTGYDEEVSADLWKRIVDEGADESIWMAGTARLNGRELTDDNPHVTLTGIRIAALDIHKIGWSHRGYVMPKGVEARQAIGVRDSVEAQEADAPVPKRERRPPDAAAIPAGAVLCSIKQAGDALGLGRTKVNELMKDGRLERREIDGGVRITVQSVMALTSKPV